MATYAEILIKEYPDRQWTMRDTGDYSTLVFHDDGPTPTKEELKAKSSKVDAAIRAERLAIQKEKNMRSKYSFQEQLVALMKRDSAKISEMVAHWDSL